MINFWLERSSEIIENDVLLVRDNGDIKRWHNMMPKVIPAIFNTVKTKTPVLSAFSNQIGSVHTIRMMKIGLEGTLEASRKYHKYPLYLLYNPKLTPKNHFWVVVYKN